MLAPNPLDEVQAQVRQVLESGPQRPAQVVRTIAAQHIAANDVRRALLLMIDRSEVALDERDMIVLAKT